MPSSPPSGPPVPWLPPTTEPSPGTPATAMRGTCTCDPVHLPVGRDIMLLAKSTPREEVHRLLLRVGETLGTTLGLSNRHAVTVPSMFPDSPGHLGRGG